jgi:hypothetical protein
MQAIDPGQGAEEQTDAERHGGCGHGHTHQRFTSAAHAEA